MWKKIVESSELVSYEKKKKDLNIRIEARLDKKKWHIFKRYFNDNGINLVENYTSADKSEVLFLIDDLLEEKDLSVGSIHDIIQMKKSGVSIRIFRDFKDYETEKWFFNVNDDKIRNWITVSFSENITADIVMHEKYRHIADSIKESLVKSLGLRKFSCNIEENCYFFAKTSYSKTNIDNKGMIISEIKMDLDG